MASVTTFTEKGVKEFQYRYWKRLESRCHQGQQCTTIVGGIWRTVLIIHHWKVL